MRKFKMGIRRFGASLSALLMIFCLTAPAFAAGSDWPSSPDFSDFYYHPNCWNVWKRTVIRGVGGYELICQPMTEYDSTNTVNSYFCSYSTDSGTYSYTNSTPKTVTYMYGIPYIPASHCSSWPDLPSFPVGEPSNICGAVRLYPFIRSGYLSNISDVFTDRSVFGYLTSWPASGDSSIADKYDHEIFDTYPVYIPSNIFFFGSKTDTSTNHTSFGIENGDNDFWASPDNSNYLKLSKSHLSTPSFRPFPFNFSIPSSDVGFVFCKDPGTGYYADNSAFNVTLSFVPVLWVPDSLLPADVAVGDWISKADVESLQDQLVKDFDVNSDTLKNSKQNFDSWQNSNTIDTDVADTGLNIINALMQNVGQFAFVVSLLCFGAVVLRVLIRKAVEG